jgi:hypothetical protein
VGRQKAVRDAKEAARSRTAAAAATGRDGETWKGDIASDAAALVTN